MWLGQLTCVAFLLFAGCWLLRAWQWLYVWVSPRGLYYRCMCGMTYLICWILAPLTDSFAKQTVCVRVCVSVLGFSRKRVARELYILQQMLCLCLPVYYTRGLCSSHEISSMCKVISAHSLASKFSWRLELASQFSMSKGILETLPCYVNPDHVVLVFYQMSIEPYQTHTHIYTLKFHILYLKVTLHQLIVMLCILFLLHRFLCLFCICHCSL